MQGREPPVHDDGCYLDTQSGTPFPVAADTAWRIVVRSTDAEIGIYFAARKG